MNAMSPILSGQQISTLDTVANWFRNEAGTKQIFRLFGYAGTGKTTIAKHLAAGFDGDVVYAAYTGKAALVMQQNGCPEASTIHSLIYRPLRSGDGDVRFVLNRDGPLATAALLVIDECSMVDERLALDVMSFNIPILVLGDPAQLPPVNGDGYFTNVKPDVMMTEIHRQAADSPIIRLATIVRENGSLVCGNFGDSRVIQFTDLQTSDFLNASQILVGTNETKKGVNSVIREELGRSGALPELDDRLVCLKNEPKLGIFNGETFRVAAAPEVDVPKGLFRMSLEAQGFDRTNVDVKVHHETFLAGAEGKSWSERRKYQEFEFCYAMTVHKAQGSQWPNLLIWDESEVFGSISRRWLYTAITRASERVTIAM